MMVLCSIFPAFLWWFSNFKPEIYVHQHFSFFLCSSEISLQTWPSFSPKSWDETKDCAVLARVNLPAVGENNHKCSRIMIILENVGTNDCG